MHSMCFIVHVVSSIPGRYKKLHIMERNIAGYSTNTMGNIFSLNITSHNQVQRWNQQVRSAAAYCIHMPLFRIYICERRIICFNYFPPLGLTMFKGVVSITTTTISISYIGTMLETLLWHNWKFTLTSSIFYSFP